MEIIKRAWHTQAGGVGCSSESLSAHSVCQQSETPGCMILFKLPAKISAQLGLYTPSPRHWRDYIESAALKKQTGLVRNWYGSSELQNVRNSL